MAVSLAGREPAQRFWYLYRVKPTEYWHDLEMNSPGWMVKYIKDDNGHQASPINRKRFIVKLKFLNVSGELRGLFFSAHLQNDVFPQYSPFGDRRFFVDATKILIPENVNLYFADFYCNSKPHYATIIVCKKDSKTDRFVKSSYIINKFFRFCKETIKPLNFYDNPFLKVSVSGGNGDARYKYFVNDVLIVEICYTEDIPLDLGAFENVIPVGKGSSQKGGKV
jgi:hypothetical protein